MNRLAVSSLATALVLGLAACGSGGMSNSTPDGGAATSDAGSPPATSDAGSPPAASDAGTQPAPDAGPGFTAGIQYNGSIAFQKVTP